MIDFNKVSILYFTSFASFLALEPNNNTSASGIYSFTRDLMVEEIILSCDILVMLRQIYKTISYDLPQKIND